MKTLTERQQEILDFIRQRQESEGMAPTLREVATHFRFSSVNAALAHVQALLAKGVLKRVPRRARSLQVVDAGPSARRRPRVVSVPIYGSIPAGRPEDAAQEAEGCVLMDVETLGIRPTARTFGLQVRGDSMIDAMVNDGDTVILQPQYEARNGEMVAVYLKDDTSATLKRFYAEDGRVRLQPANPTLAPIYIENPEEVRIQGKVVLVIRQPN